MKKICVVTGNRAEYGLLLPLMKALQQDKEFSLQIVVTGAHLSQEFGLTYQQIEIDGFIIDSKVDMLLSGDTSVAIAKSVGIAVIGLADVFARLQPDFVVILGDRYEALAVAQTAMIMKIPIGHIHGGERTEGAIDESIRHAITKMANLHFTAAEEYRQRVIQMGERPECVFNVGALCLDSIKNLPLWRKEELEENLSFSFHQLNFLVTYHPETLLSDEENLNVLEELLRALDSFPDAGVIFTGANPDVCGSKINNRLQMYVESQPARAIFCMSLGQKRYFSAVKYVDIVLGNSSSGIIEIPFLGKPTINIGNRQKGRLRSRAVLDCPGISKEIVASIQLSLSQEFQDKLIMEKEKTVYGKGETVKEIIDILKIPFLKDQLIQKRFYDIAF